MSEPQSDIDHLVSKASAALQSASHDSARVASIRVLIAELQSAMEGSPDARQRLGPVIGQLRSTEKLIAESPFHWVPVLQGRLAIGHRPQIRTICNMRLLGATHVMTLLSESEGAKSIGEQVRRAELSWIWLPLRSADPPSPERHEEILQVLNEIQTALSSGANIYIHCSAGIHRTGMIAWAILRHIGMDADNALSALTELRQETAQGVGDDRKHWGDRFVAGRGGL